jgi:hypothetical protein
MAAQAKGTGRAKSPRGPAKPKAPAAAKAKGTPKVTVEPKTPAARDVAAAPAGPVEPARQRPAALRLAAAAQGLEAAGLFVAGVFAALSTVDGKSYQLASGIALTVIAFGTAAGLAAIAVGLATARPWSRTPAVMAQLFVIIAGITLLDGRRPEWGVPAVALAAACLAGLLTPASLRALNRPSTSSADSVTSATKSR